MPLWIVALAIVGSHRYKMRLLSGKRGGPGPAAASNIGITPLTVRILAEVKMPNLKCSCIHTQLAPPDQSTVLLQLCTPTHTAIASLNKSVLLHLH